MTNPECGKHFHVERPHFLIRPNLINLNKCLQQNLKFKLYLITQLIYAKLKRNKRLYKVFNDFFFFSFQESIVISDLKAEL